MNVDLANFNWGCEYEILTFHHLWHYNPKFLNWNMTSSLVQPLTLWDFNESFHSSTTTLDINNSNQIKCFILKDLEVRTFKRKVVNLMAYKLKNCNSHIMSTFFFFFLFIRISLSSQWLKWKTPKYTVQTSNTASTFDFL